MQKNIKLRNLKVTEEALSKITNVSKAYAIPRYVLVDMLLEILVKHQDELFKVHKRRILELSKKSLDNLQSRVNEILKESTPETYVIQKENSNSVQSLLKHEEGLAQINGNADTGIDFLKGKIERNELISEIEQETLLKTRICPKCGKDIEVLETYMRCSCGYSCNGSPDQPLVHNKYRNGVTRSTI